MVIASLLYAVCLYRAYGALDTLSLYIYYELLVVEQDVYTVTIVTKIIVCKIQVKVSFGDGNKAIINIWSHGNTYAVTINGILYHLIQMAITNEGLVFLF